MSRTLVFDLDGTLVDSVPDLAASLNRLMAARLLAPFSLPAVTAMVGDGVAALVRRAMAARGRAVEDRDIADFTADYGAHPAELSRAYPGAVETLTALRDAGWRLAVCTNKPEAPAGSLLAALGLRDFISAIGGGDSFPVRKPDPGHLLATIARAGGAAARAILVGDHENDVLAAAGAGVPCVFARWGYGREGGAGTAAQAARLADVPALAERLLPR